MWWPCVASNVRKGKKKVSHVFMSLCRHAFQVQGRITTWSWTCRFATRIIVSPPTGRNRSEVWLLPERKQSCSQKSFLFFISLLFSPHPTSSSFVTLCNSVNPLGVSTAGNFLGQPERQNMLKAQPRPQSIALFHCVKLRSDPSENFISSEKTEKKKKNPTRPIRHRLGELIHVNSPAPQRFNHCVSLSHL